MVFKRKKLDSKKSQLNGMVVFNPLTGIGRVFLAAILLGLFFAGCIETPPINNQLEFKELQRFASYEELEKALEEAGSAQRSYGIADAVTIGIVKQVSAPSSSAQESSAGTSADIDFSTTNIQVEGVDEADIVKSDGKFIYNFAGNSLVITDAYPIESAQIVSSTVLEGISPLEMFVSGDKLLLFGNSSYQPGPVPLSQTTIEPDIYYPYYYGGTKALLFDVSDRSNPFLEKELEFSGNYLTSRLIGDHAYFVVKSYPYYFARGMEGLPAEDYSVIPLMKEDGVEKPIASAEEIGVIYPIPAQEFVSIISLDLESKEIQKETVLAQAESVFASTQNIYLAGTVWLPLTDTPVVTDVERAIVGDSEKTVVYKFNLEQGKINFVGQASVPGHVLNQFSMDEFEGNFRIATTVGNVWGSGADQSTNNLYVLGPQMNLVGSLVGLAPGEKIYSARFMGSRAYLVTFKKVDPLFVIDLSVPSSPRVLGKLKIPGYSDYLHPFDETHIIGIGKDTIEPSDDLLQGRGFDFAWYQGIKMAIFDVTDVENPIELHKIVIGERGTESYALHDHKAFLFDKEKELLVIPVTLAEIPQSEKKPLEENQRSPAYGVPVFQGAMVFKVNLFEGFVERGRITHVSAEEELKSGYYYADTSQVKRALFIEDVLYTLSEKMLKANDLDTLQELKEFVFYQLAEPQPY